MRRISADWRAIEGALQPHQVRTLRDYAASKGLATDALWTDPVACTVAMSLAVDNALADLEHAGGRVDRRSLIDAAVRFDLDVETLLRRERRIGRRGKRAG